MVLYKVNKFQLVIYLYLAIDLIKGQKTVIDLSYTYDSTTVYWPTEREEAFKFTKLINSTDPISGEHYEANSFCTAEHGGTHLDAPSHFAAGKYGVDMIPVTKLVNYGIVIDVSSKTLINRNYEIQEIDFQDWERKNGEIISNTIVLIYTGFGQKLPNLTDYFGTPTTNDSLLRFPGLSSKGAAWLVNKKIACVGIDTASIDYGKSTTYQTHKILTAAEIPIFENIANLHLVPTKGAMVVALPMKIGKGSGAPLRIVAYYDEKSFASTIRPSFIVMATVVMIISICNHLC